MTLGDAPDLDIASHPITRKLWLEDRLREDTAEVFEDGYVIIFDKRGTKKYSKKYISQRIAVNEMKKEGWIYWV